LPLVIFKVYKYGQNEILQQEDEFLVPAGTLSKKTEFGYFTKFPNKIGSFVIALLYSHGK